MLIFLIFLKCLFLDGEGDLGSAKPKLLKNIRNSVKKIRRQSFRSNSSFSKNDENSVLGKFFDKNEKMDKDGKREKNLKKKISRSSFDFRLKTFETDSESENSENESDKDNESDSENEEV